MAGGGGSRKTTKNNKILDEKREAGYWKITQELQVVWGVSEENIIGGIQGDPTELT